MECIKYPIDYSVPFRYDHTDYLYYTSHLIGLSSLVSYYHADYATFIFMFSLFITSINYWNNPSYGVRRNLDLILSKIINVYFYGITLLFKDEFQHTIFVNILYNVLFIYFIENIYIYYNNGQWIIFHMMIHIYLSIFTPFILYIL